MIKSIILYFVIYCIITFIMSYDEVLCAINGEQLCWINLIGKLIIFSFCVLIFNKLIRPKIFKNERKN